MTTTTAAVATAPPGSPGRSTSTARARSSRSRSAPPSCSRRRTPTSASTSASPGTGGGFEKFCAGETDISDASRPIEEEEIALCEKNGITYDELQVASDGIAVVTNPALEVSCLSTEQLKQLWNKGSSVANLSELGNDADSSEALPDAELSLYGPGHGLRHVRLLHRDDQR